MALASPPADASTATWRPSGTPSHVPEMETARVSVRSKPMIDSPGRMLPSARAGAIPSRAAMIQKRPGRSSSQVNLPSTPVTAKASPRVGAARAVSPVRSA